jgi:hypothetical protein
MLPQVNNKPKIALKLVSSIPVTSSNSYLREKGKTERTAAVL